MSHTGVLPVPNCPCKKRFDIASSKNIWWTIVVTSSKAGVIRPIGENFHQFCHIDEKREMGAMHLPYKWGLDFYP